MIRRISLSVSKMISSVCVLTLVFGCATQIKPSLYFSLEDNFDGGHLSGEKLDGIPNKIYTDVNFYPGSSSVSGAGALSRNFDWSALKAIAEINLNELYKKKNIEQVTLNILLAPNNSIDPAYREFNVYLFEGNGVIDYEDFSRPGSNIGTFNFTLPESKTLQIEILDYVKQLLSRQIAYLGVRIEPIGNNPPSVTLVKFIQIK